MIIRNSRSMSCGRPSKNQFKMKQIKEGEGLMEKDQQVAKEAKGDICVIANYLQMLLIITWNIFEAYYEKKKDGNEENEIY